MPQPAAACVLTCKREALLDNSIVGGRGVVLASHCLLSPAGTAAACVWSDTRLRWRDQHYSSGVRMACQEPDRNTGTWLTPVPDAREPATWGTKAYGWSSSGRYLGAIFSRSFKGCGPKTEGLGLQVGSLPQPACKTAWYSPAEKACSCSLALLCQLPCRQTARCRAAQPCSRPSSSRCQHCRGET